MTLICTYIYMYTWVYTAEVTAKRIRERYLRAILRQDIAFFDDVGPGEVTTRIQTDTRMWSFFFQPTAWCRQQTLHTPRFGSSRHIREGRRRSHLSLLIRCRFYLSVCEELAFGPGSVFHSALDFDRGWLHEQSQFQVYPVRPLSRDFYEPRIHSISASPSNMSPKVEPSQRKSCLRSVRLMPSAPKMCLHPCMTSPYRRPTMRIADLQSHKA